jgi:tight adherence protein B
VTPAIVLLALGFGAGGWLVFTGWSGWSGRPGRAGLTTANLAAWRERLGPQLGVRFGWSAGASLFLGAATRWPVAALTGAAAGWFAPDLFCGRAARDRGIARTEAIAGWAESLRDTISGARGLEAALASTAPVAPLAIRPELSAFAERVYREPLPAALRALADDLAHPTADLVVAALSMAASGSVRDLGELLGTLAVAAREEASMRLRVDAARARMRTAVQVIAACTLVTAAGLVAFNPSYVSIYSSALGQLVLAVIAGIWGVSLWWIARMSEFAVPERFLTIRAGASS